MTIDFEKGNGLVPAIVQDNFTRKVLMLGYMNKEALTKTKKTGLVTFYSRRKARLWTKGEVSGNVLKVKNIAVDCDNDSLLIQVIPQGPTCHTGSDTCWNETNTSELGFLLQLENLINERKIQDSNPNSYVSSLFDKGINSIAQKVGEEAVELVIEAKDNNDNLFLNEAADLLFHVLILLSVKEQNLQNVVNVLQNRQD